MSLNENKYVDLDTSEYSLVEAGLLQVGPITDKPPVETDFSTTSDYDRALQEHYTRLPAGITLGQGMKLETDRITFPDNTFMTTASTGGGGDSNLTLTNATDTGLRSIDALHHNSSITTSNTLSNGIQTNGYLPGPNGKNNALPEDCNRMVFLQLPINLSSLGGSTNGKVYIPAYFKIDAPPIVTPNLQLARGPGYTYTNSAILMDLFEGNVGISLTDGIIINPVLYPNQGTVRVRVDPPPPSGTIITLELDKSGNWPDFVDRSETIPVLPIYLTESNNWSVDWSFEVEDNEVRDELIAGIIDITTVSTNLTYNGLTNRVSVLYHDNQDSVIIRTPPWENKAIQISPPGSSNPPQFWYGMNTVNSPNFSFEIEYVAFGESRTGTNTGSILEGELSTSWKTKLATWRSSIPKQTTTKYFPNVYVSTSSQLVGANASELYDILFQIAPDLDENGNVQDDEDDSNNKTYQWIIIFKNLQTNDIGVKHLGGSGDPVKTFSGNPANASYTSTNIRIPTTLEVHTWMIFGDLVDVTSGGGDDGGGDDGGGEEDEEDDDGEEEAGGVDTLPPIISNMPNNISVSTNAGQNYATVTWTEPTVTDNEGSTVTITKSHEPGSNFNLGTTQVTYTAEDAAGNQASDSFNIIVTDNENPVISNMPTNISVTTSVGENSAIVTWTEPTITDNVAVTSIVKSHNSGSSFNVGTTTVTYTVEDANGNQTSNSFNVVVTLPELLPNTFVVTVSGGKYYIDGQGPVQTLTLTRGTTYNFDQTNNTNASHPLRISTTQNGTHGGGSQYTNGFITNGGTAGSTLTSTFSVPIDAPNALYYYCANHSNMGGAIIITPVIPPDDDGGDGPGGGGTPGDGIENISHK